MTLRSLCAVLHKKQEGRDAGEALSCYTWFWHKITCGLSALLLRPTSVGMANAQWGCGLPGGWLGYPLPAPHSAPHNPALANRGQEGERCQSGELGCVLYSSEKPKSFIADCLLSWLTEGMGEGRSHHWS